MCLYIFPFSTSEGKNIPFLLQVNWSPRVLKFSPSFLFLLHLETYSCIFNMPAWVFLLSQNLQTKIFPLPSYWFKLPSCVYLSFLTQVSKNFHGFYFVIWLLPSTHYCNYTLTAHKWLPDQHIFLRLNPSWHFWQLIYLSKTISSFVFVTLCYLVSSLLQTVLPFIPFMVFFL